MKIFPIVKTKYVLSIFFRYFPPSSPFRNPLRLIAIHITTYLFTSGIKFEQKKIIFYYKSFDFWRLFFTVFENKNRFTADKLHQVSYISHCLLL